MMRHILQFVLLALLAQDVTPPKPASIRGVVVEWGTTTGVSQAIVELRDTENLGGQSAEITATTDEGEFTIQGVHPASYQIVVTRPGFAQASYGQKRPSGTGLTLKMSEDQRVTGLKISMARGGDISGRITDRNGQPVPFVNVRALSATLQRPVQAAITDDLGEYRLFWLPPGAYYITARANDQQTFGRIVVVNPDGSGSMTFFSFGGTNKTRTFYIANSGEEIKYVETDNPDEGAVTSGTLVRQGLPD